MTVIRAMAAGIGRTKSGLTRMKPWLFLKEGSSLHI
jgi:hypothetical protein